MKLKDKNIFQKKAYIGGEWIEAEDGRTFEVLNPADGSVIASVPNMGGEETRQAIEQAEKAWGPWREKTANERSTVLRRWYELVCEHAEDLALIITTEQGKPLAEAQGEVRYGASFLEWFGEEAKRVSGQVLQTHKVDARVVVLKEPVGVVAAITPWNFPMAMITRKAAPALAAGCPVVMKPAEETPLSALALAELGRRAGIPAGVLNVVTGEPESIGAELTSNPIVRKLSFTGSTQVGKLLMRQCAETLKKISLELGGNAPFIVFDDAHIDRAVEGALACKCRNTGQACVSANRFYIQESVYSEFAQKFVKRMKSLKVGRGTEAGVEQGPLINQAAIKKVHQHIHDACSKGGEVLCGGKIHALGGTFFAPTVLGNANAQMLLHSEETFGPVAPLFRFQDEVEVVKLANNTRYGLASYFYTQDLGRAWRVAEALESGVVAINEGVFSTELAPFGGMKESGIGREGGSYGIEEFLEVKYCLMGGV